MYSAQAPIVFLNRGQLFRGGCQLLKGQSQQADVLYSGHDLENRVLDIQWGHRNLKLEQVTGIAIPDG